MDKVKGSVVTRYKLHKLIIPLLLLPGAVTAAEKTNEYERCLLEALKEADANASVETIKRGCEQQDTERRIGAISNRVIQERNAAFNPYVITPHHMNYILPITVTDDINRDAYRQENNLVVNNLIEFAENLEDEEAKFQLSIKIPLNYDSMFVEGDGLFFAFTLQSWWQIYSNNISKPFRETNYRPELFYMMPLDWQLFGGNTGLVFGAEHQSNGRSQLISRSWNRVFFDFLFEKNSFALSFRPWLRIQESDKEDPFSSKGDDNPDIEDFMGYFELTTVYQWQDYEFSFRGRNNFAEHKGLYELGFTFPLWGKLRGYAQFIDGYGESLIDYNYKQQRFGVGLALTNVL